MCDKCDNEWIECPICRGTGEGRYPDTVCHYPGCHGGMILCDCRKEHFEIKGEET